MLKLTIDTRGIETVLAKLHAVRDALEDRTEAHEEIKQRQNERWIVNFMGQGSEYVKWEPLSESWVRKRGSATPILRWNHTMFNDSVRPQQDAAQVARDATTWGFDDQPPNFPMTHHKGKASAFNIPARPIWETDDQDDERNRDIMEEYVNRVVAQYF